MQAAKEVIYARKPDGTPSGFRLYEHSLSPRFANDPRTIKGVNMLNAVDVLARADAVGIVSKVEYYLTHVHIHFRELAAAPRQDEAVTVRGISDLVIGVTA